MTDSDLAGEQVFWNIRDHLPETQRIELPEDRKDPGEMTHVEIGAALGKYVKLTNP